MLVAVFAGAVVWKALVGQRPAAGIAADAEDLRAGAHLPAGGVVEHVALEAARGMELESSGLKAAGEAGQIRHSKFDFGLDGHRKERVYVSRVAADAGNGRQ